MSNPNSHKGYKDNSHEKEDRITAFVRATHESLFPKDNMSDQKTTINSDEEKKNNNDPSKNNDKQNDEQTP